MKRVTRSSCAVIGLLAACTWRASCFAGGPTVDALFVNPLAKTELQADRLIVRYKDRRAAMGIDDLKNLKSLVLDKSVTYVRRMSGNNHLIALGANVRGADLGKTIAQLRSDPSVEYVEPDTRVYPLAEPVDPRYGEQWHYFDRIAGVNMPAAWDMTVGDPGIVVAIIDTGIAPHSELTDRRLPGYDFISDPARARDGDGRDSDASDAGDWQSIANDPLCPVRNSSWHGAHVAGTVGANANNGLGGVGINWKSKILPVRVLGACGGYKSDVIDAMRWAAGLPVPGIPLNPHPAHVLNLSLGERNACGSAYQDAIDDVVAVGKTIVVAAGNSNADAIGFAPAGCAKVITVGATNRSGLRSASYSNYGAAVTISAPGGEYQDRVLSTLNGGSMAPMPSPAGDSYGGYIGTSMAAPHVTGVVSLMLSVNRSLTSVQIKEALQRTARRFSAGSDCYSFGCGAGIVDAAAAIAAVGGQPTPAPIKSNILQLILPALVGD